MQKILALFSPGSRKDLIWILLFYFLPVVIYSSFFLHYLPRENGWQLLIAGFLLGVVGSLFFINMGKLRENSLRQHANKLLKLKLERLMGQSISQETTIIASNRHSQEILHAEPSYTFSPETIISPSFSPPAPVNEIQIQALQADLTESQQKIHELTQEIDDKSRGLRQADYELDKSCQNIKKLELELTHSREQADDTLKHKESLLGEYQQTILEQRKVLEKKHQYIAKLEKKVRDLSYEIKTLLQIGDLDTPDQHHLQNRLSTPDHPLINVFDEKDSSHPNHSFSSQQLSLSSEKEIVTPYDAAVQLQKCIARAQKLRGIPSLSEDSPRFASMSLDHYAIDLRRLFDSFRNENSTTIFVYSPNEERLLFVNNHVKTSLGWSPERFVKDFNTIIQKGSQEWLGAISNLQHSHESQTKFLIRRNTGEEVLVHCHLGTIPDGVFKSYVIGILFTV